MEVALTEQKEYKRRDAPSTRSRGGPRRQYRRRPRLCKFCANKTTHINYKQHDLLKRYIKESGKIRSRRETGNCAGHQRMVSGAIKRARHMALLPFTVERLR
ncbi:MAG: 30S ribosomal protein S18 [Anaerolineales bacterium]|nr:30S ribosomal protein S18 [Anaerolineales bacterium]MCK5634935.1 30S ribosomal protein S18 [Anaerolineales bacterium]